MAIISTLALGFAAAEPAAAQTVLEATVFGAGAAATSPRAVSAQALSQCPQYSGSNPITLYPTQQSYPVPATSWSLSTVLTCALGIPGSDVSTVQVLNPPHGYERSLSAADLTDPGRYQDPAAPQALPVIATDGGQDLNTFTRPWRGGGDENSRDQVTENQAPVSIVVYAQGVPLTVNVAQSPVRKGLQSFVTRLSATVSDGGALLPASDLAWNWSFDDGRSSPQATPTHTFANGSYAVTLLVTDHQTGRGGTATLLVSAPVHVPAGQKAQSGAQKRSKSTSPTGSDASRATRPGGSPAQRPGPPVANPSSSAATVPTRTVSGTATNSSPAPRPVASDPRAAVTHRPARRPTDRNRRRSLRPPAQKLVTGRLIADITPLPPGLIPLNQHRATPGSPTPAVRPASTGPRTLSAPMGALAVLALLALGAWREGRGLRPRRTPRADG